MAQALMSNSAQWGYSVPLDETDINARPPQARRQTTQGSAQQQQQSQERDYRTMKSGTRRPVGPGENGIQSDSEEARQRRRNVKAGNATATRKRSRNALRPAGAGAGGAAARDRSQDTAASQSNLDDSAWIHRDKLAQIEIQEMVEAGIPVRHSRRSMSAGPAVNERSSRSLEREDEDAVQQQQQQSYEGYEQEYDFNGYEEFERKRISTIDQADEEDQYYENQTNGAGYHSPQDTTTAGTANREVTPPWSPSHNSRPSTSRIPVSTGSAVPVPQNVVGRDSPLPRSRHGGQAPSGNWEEMMHGRRVRSNSVGSQVLLEDERNTSLPSPTSPTALTTNNSSSPLKSRVPGKPVNGQRKGSIPTPVRPGSSAGGSRKQPATAATSPTAQRSNSRSGHHAAPTGDPPWVTDMFKPDPRLPPDQQMLPTHAKRLAQQQWEREGKGTSSAYDREFRPMNDRDPSPSLVRDGSRLGNYDGSDVEDVRSHGNTTLLDTSAHTRNPTTGNINTNTSNSSNGGSAQLNAPDTSSPTKSVGGGYKITPTITSPPEIRRSPTTGPYTSGAMGGMTAQANPNAMLDEKGGAGGAAGDDGQGKTERGCACCVVM